jgi:hypothetical protein
VTGTGSSISVTAVKLGTMTVTVASWIGLTVSAHRDGSPNRSCSRSASVAVYRRRCGSIRIWQRSAMA